MGGRQTGEIARPNTGKLMPGSKIVWDIHHHAIGEAITDSVEMIYFYPKGQEPKIARCRQQFDAITGGDRTSTFRRTASPCIRRFT